MASKKGATHTKKHQKKSNKITFKSELIVPNEEECEFVGRISKALGSCRFTIENVNNTQDTCQAAALRSFKSGPTKEIINIGDYVLVQPGISKNQFFITHRYNENDKIELTRRCIVGNIQSNTVLSSEPEATIETAEEETNIDDIFESL